MTEKVRMPTDLDQVTLKLLGKFDTKDLARLTAPPATAIIYLYQTPNPSTAAYGLLGLAVVLGGVWTLWKPWGRPLDQNLYHAIRWKTQKNIEATPHTDSGYITTQGSATALIEIEPVNLELKSGTEKAAFHKLQQELLHTLDYRLELYTTQTPLNVNDYLDNLEPSDELQDNYRDYCESLSRDGQNETRHFAALHVDNGDNRELEKRVDEVLEHLNAGGLNAHRITEPETPNQTPSLEPGHVHHPAAERKTISKTVYVTEYPRDTSFSWVTQILQVDGLVDITQIIEPKHPAETVSRLQKLENKAEAENASLVRKGYGSSRRLERLLGDVDWFQNLLADQDDQPVRYGVYITAYGKTPGDCEDTLRNVENRLKALGIDYRSTGLRTDQSYYATTPGYTDKLNEHLLVPAGSAAAGFPFTSPTAVDETGVLFGSNHNTGTPIVLDRFKWNAGHAVLAGVTGSGKSFHSKLLLLRSVHIYDDLHINIVDPKPEYGKIAQKLRKYTSVTRFEPGGSITDADDLIEAVEEAYQDARQTDMKTIVVVDEAHRLLKTEDGASILSTLVREARSTNTAVTLITQTISDFYRSEDGADILKNTPCKLLFAHENADDKPEDAFNLSTVAETQLYNLARGDDDTADYSQAILNVTNQLESQIKIEAATAEQQLIENGEITHTNTNNAENSPDSETVEHHHPPKNNWLETAKNTALATTSNLEQLELPDLNPGLEKQKTELTELKQSVIIKLEHANKGIQRQIEALKQSVKIPEIDIDGDTSKIVDDGAILLAGIIAVSVVIGSGVAFAFLIHTAIEQTPIQAFLPIVVLSFSPLALLVVLFTLYGALKIHQEGKQ